MTGGAAGGGMDDAGRSAGGMGAGRQNRDVSVSRIVSYFNVFHSDSNLHIPTSRIFLMTPVNKSS